MRGREETHMKATVNNRQRRTIIHTVRRAGKNLSHLGHQVPRTGVERRVVKKLY